MKFLVNYFASDDFFILFKDFTLLFVFNVENGLHEEHENDKADVYEEESSNQI
jgi:hypothetical protein